MDKYIDSKTAISTAKLLSSPAAFGLAGYCFCLVQNTIPALYDHKPQVTTPVFKQVWTSAGPIVPTLTVLSGSAFGYLAYALPAQRREFTTATVAMLITIPWSGLVMMPGINRLITISEDKDKIAKSEQSLEHRQLMISTVTRKYIMVALQFFSAVVGLRAIMV